MTSAAFAAGGGTVAFATGELGVPGRACVNVADATTGRLLEGIVVGEDVVAALALSPDGVVAATVDASGAVTLWDTEDGLPALGQVGSAFGAAVRSVAVSPDGRLLATGGAGGWVTLWSLQPSLSGELAAISRQAVGSPPSFLSLRPVRRLVAFAAGGGRAVTSLAFAADGGLLAAGTAAGEVGLWRVDRSRPVPLARRLRTTGAAAGGGAVRALAADAAAGLLASADARGVAAVVDLATGRPRLLGRPAAAGGAVEALSFAAGGRKVELALRGGDVRLIPVPPA